MDTDQHLASGLKKKKESTVFKILIRMFFNVSDEAMRTDEWKKCQKIRYIYFGKSCKMYVYFSNIGTVL